MSDYQYQGDELDLFAEATNWKRCIAAALAPWLRGDVLEVGAGLGTTTAALWRNHVRSWTCLEPDPALANRIPTTTRGIVPAETLVVRTGTLESLPPIPSFDTILYIDVLEHIEKDRDEVENAARRLRNGGMLIVLAPAHPTLYSEWDRSLGHFRRYHRRSLLALNPSTLHPVHARYYDSIGALLSTTNRCFLKQGHITLRQIHFWDKVIIPLSKWVDPLLGRFFGRSIVVVWEKASI